MSITTVEYFFAYARNLILFYCAVVKLHSLCLRVIRRVSKFVDQIAVAKQLQHHLFTDNLIPASQSAYRPNHSTETALLRVTNDILIKMNNQCVTLLILLLDLSTAFDTIDYDTLLNRLQFSSDIKDLSRLKSYFSRRSQ